MGYNSLLLIMTSERQKGKFPGFLFMMYFQCILHTGCPKAALVFIRVISKHNFTQNELVDENKPKVSNAPIVPTLRTNTGWVD